MGNANPLASTVGAAGAKRSAGNAVSSAQDGLNTLTAAPTDAQKAQAERAKDRNAAYEQKKKEREERKKKLQSQWAAHKKN